MNVENLFYIWIFEEIIETMIIAKIDEKVINQIL